MLARAVALLALTAAVHAASQIALFTDQNCTDSYKGLEGPNGYPNGTCTDLRRSGEYGSLQVVGLDAGCAVTIYVEDDDTTECGGFQEEIQLGECWNSTFVYYSIDMCDIGGSTESSTSTSTASSRNMTGTLVGAVLGGLAGGVLILGIALWLLARKKRARKEQAAAAAAFEHDRDDAGFELGVQQSPHRSEMDGSIQRHEMSQGKIVYKHQAAEVAQPPAELGGLEIGRSGDAGR